MDEPDLDGFAMADISGVEDVIDRDGLNTICRSFFELFGLSIRVFSHDGSLLADIHEAQEVCRYVNTIPAGAKLCAQTVGEVQRLTPSKKSIVHPCFTGAEYRVVPIRYQARHVGHFVVGPYVPALTREVPRTLLKLTPGMDRQRCQQTLTQVPE